MRRAAFDKPVTSAGSVRSLSEVEGPVLSIPAVSGSTRLTTGFDYLRTNGWDVEGLTTNGYVTVILKRITKGVYFFRAPRLSPFLLFFCFRISSWFNGPPGPYSFLCCWISSTKSIGSFDGTLNVHHVCPL